MDPRSATLSAKDFRPFDVWSGVEGRPPLVSVRGEVDVATVPELRGVLRSCLERGARTVVLDFSRVDSIGARGLSVLVDAHRRLRQRGGRLLVRRASPSVSWILEIVGVAELPAAHRVPRSAAHGRRRGRGPDRHRVPRGMS